MSYDGHNVSQVIDDILCTDVVKYRLSGMIEQMCPCFWLCDDYSYTKGVSFADWPRTDVLLDLIDFVTTRGIDNSATRTCAMFRRMFANNVTETADGDEVHTYMGNRGNVVHVQVGTLSCSGYTRSQTKWERPRSEHMASLSHGGNPQGQSRRVHTQGQT